ncbi:P-loop containing nucleoside triphosphate hydrolase protein [Hypoxylon crocopeplum]|nr:P-loop containing nucleoside triphosphate hydrolase protein [Hypoxylon crocopeplum]
MDSVYTLLAHRALALQQAAEEASHDSDSNRPWRAVIALAGPPGSGKTRIAQEVARRLNAGRETPAAAVVPMDGFHYTRATLGTFPNPAEAHARRGAAWTFDAIGVVALFTELEASRRAKRTAASTIYVPSFDHATKDPVSRDIAIPPTVSLVILEGNWLLYDEEPWRRISQLVDESWFVDVDAEVAKYRVAQRHVQSGIESTMEDALARAESNDVPNGDEVRRKLITPTITVQSVDKGV